MTEINPGKAKQDFLTSREVILQWIPVTDIKQLKTIKMEILSKMETEE